MQLKQLSDEMAADLHMSERDMHKIMKALLTRLRTGIESNEEFVIPQLGKFVQRKNDAGKVRIFFRPFKNKAKDDAAAAPEGVAAGE